MSAVEAISLRHVAATRAHAHVDIEVISDPYVDVPAGPLDAAGEQALAAAFADRYARLRAPFDELRSPDALVVRGAPRAEGPPGAESDAGAQTRVWEAARTQLTDAGGVSLWIPGPPQAADEGACEVFLLQDGLLEDGTPGEASELIAVVALVTLPAEPDGTTPSPAEETIRELAADEGRTVPLFVVGIDAGDDAERLLPWCQRLRATLVLSSGDGRGGVLTISRTLLRGRHATDVAVVPCPSFAPGIGKPGLTRLRIDAIAGEARIAFRPDLGSDRSPRPIQVVRRLSSASRVTASERRLRTRIDELIAEGREAPETDRTRLDAFAAHVEKSWADDAYAALCDWDAEAGSSGSLPLRPARDETYNLLLLLREREDEGGYDVLLSNHSPLRRSTLSDWNTLLMPAFRSTRLLLERLRDDVLRQVAERADDFERTMHAKQFEEAVNTVLVHEAREGEEPWADEIREVATRTIRKVSPTTGVVTTFDYHLVTLLPLIDRGNAVPEDEVGDEADVATRLRNARRRIVAWLDGLDTVLPEEVGGSGLPVEALMSDGAGLRWDPEAMLAEDPDRQARRRREHAHPGAIWFPLELEAPLWRSCPSIVARNADVMTWVEQELGRLRVEDRFPDELVLGRHTGGSGAYVVEQRFPFAQADEVVPAPDDDEDQPPARSTEAALAKISFQRRSDLWPGHAYADAEIVRVWLLKQSYPGREQRQAIFVYQAEPGDDGPEPALARAPLGMLRPVQRYVLRAGLDRARDIQEALQTQAPDPQDPHDPWGFVRIRKGAAPRLVAVTPPIIEQLHADDWDDGGVGRDFVVCDGNHRIVYSAWLPEAPVPVAAVAAMTADERGSLPEPYYARPFGRFEWDSTAENELVTTPALASKYVTRAVRREHVEAEIRAALEATEADDERTLLEGRLRRLSQMGDRDLYRRYYRDLESGFGALGGQGGKFVG